MAQSARDGQRRSAVLIQLIGVVAISKAGGNTVGLATARRKVQVITPAGHPSLFKFSAGAKT